MMSSSSSPNHQDKTGRIIGKIRVFNTAKNSYGDWEDIVMTGNETERIINLNRCGGKLVFRPQIITPREREKLSTAMRKCRLFRQYSFGAFNEPRSHVLLSSKLKSDRKNRGSPGYVYHNIRMKAYPLDLLPCVERLAKRLAKQHHIKEWNTGVNMIVYKDGADRIGWHADDTQGESLVVSLTVTCPEPRRVRIRPNKKYQPLSDGDEEIELTPLEGDAYDMDGAMQIGYEHGVPPVKSKLAHRFAIVFRNGEVGHVSDDSGENVVEMTPPKHFSPDITHQLYFPPPGEDFDVIAWLSAVRCKLPPVTFGHSDFIEEGHLYTRQELYLNYAHRADQRGINGNKDMGCDSIVVAKQNSYLREQDGATGTTYLCSSRQFRLTKPIICRLLSNCFVTAFNQLLYTSNRKQGALSLFRSFRNNSPIRVFRSSKLENIYSPPPFPKKTSYRYDGLYTVIKAFDSEGIATNQKLPVGNEQFTFFLERLPSHLASTKMEKNNVNEYSTIELLQKMKLPSNQPLVLRCDQLTPIPTKEATPVSMGVKKGGNSTDRLLLNKTLSGKVKNTRKRKRVIKKGRKPKLSRHHDEKDNVTIPAVSKSVRHITPRLVKIDPGGIYLCNPPLVASVPEDNNIMKDYKVYVSVNIQRRNCRSSLKKSHLS